MLISTAPAVTPLLPCFHVRVQHIMVIKGRNKVEPADSKRAACSAQGRKRAACGAQGPRKQPKLICPSSKGNKFAGEVLWCQEAQVPSVADCRGLLGDAQETDAAHAARHPVDDLAKWAKVCARCRFRQWAKSRSRRIGTPAWLRPKPSFMQGAWGLGCTVCAAGAKSPAVQARRSSHMTDNRRSGRCQQRISRCGVWSRYEVRCFRSCKVLTWLIKQHEAIHMHRLCQTVFDTSVTPWAHLEQSSDPRGAYFTRCLTKSQFESHESNMQPVAHDRADGPPANAVICSVGSVTDPFRGMVPQCKDWLQAWAENTSCVSTEQCTTLSMKII